MCHVRRRFFRPGAAEDVKGARRGAADAMVRRAYDEFAQFLHQTGVQTKSWTDYAAKPR